MAAISRQADTADKTYATIKGFEVMRALRKGQAKAFQIQPGIKGEVRLIKRAFALGPDMLPEGLDHHHAEIENWAA